MNQTACEFMKTHEWCQGHYAQDADGKCTIPDDGTKFCIMGAILMCYPYYDGEREARAKLHAYLGNNPISWNDQPGRTKEEVVEALCKAGV